MGQKSEKNFTLTNKRIIYNIDIVAKKYPLCVSLCNNLLSAPRNKCQFKIDAWDLYKKN